MAHPPQEWTEAGLRDAMPALTDASEAELRQLARWAGPNRRALEIASRGAAILGVARWCTSYETEPEVWLAAVGGADTGRRWRRAWGALADAPRRWLRTLSGCPAGLDLSTMLACVERPADGVATLDTLLRSGWVAQRGERVEMPTMRRQLVREWHTLTSAQAAARDRFLLRYTARRLSRDAAWTLEDRTCLAACLARPSVARGLDDAELVRAASALRHTTHAGFAVGVLRARLGSAPRSKAPGLRQTLGGSLLDMGAYCEGILVLSGRSRASRVMRAHAHIERGDLAQGRSLLRAVGPREGDSNWALQWALAATYARDPEADTLLREQLEAAVEARHRGLVWGVCAEAADRRADAACLERYPRAIAALGGAGDEMGATYCQARYARALGREGQRDKAAHVSERAWQRAAGLPSVTVRGLAALACVEAGLASHEMLQGALRAAANAESPDLARDAAAALTPSPAAPIVGLGPTDARLDGAPIRLAGQGPPWRLLVHLCHLPAGSIVSLEELFEVGWPGQRIRAASQRKRVHTAVWTLRRAGLRGVLETVGRDRYRLRARVIVEPSNLPPEGR
ncbi:MAG: hypothetical protein AB8I08_03140 [Sandaracinaceae bacterium]